MSTMKITQKTKRIKLMYPTRKQRDEGITHREEQVFAAHISGMTENEHAVVLNKGEIKTLYDVLTFVSKAALLFPGDYRFDRIACIQLKLETLIAPAVVSPAQQFIDDHAKELS